MRDVTTARLVYADSGPDYPAVGVACARGSWRLLARVTS